MCLCCSIDRVSICANKEIYNKWLFLSDVTFLATILCVSCTFKYYYNVKLNTYGYRNSIPVTSCLENYLKCLLFFVGNTLNT